jgi:hypothetical protein
MRQVGIAGDQRIGLGKPVQRDQVVVVAIRRDGDDLVGIVPGLGEALELGDERSEVSRSR